MDLINLLRYDLGTIFDCKTCILAWYYVHNCSCPYTIHLNRSLTLETLLPV